MATKTLSVWPNPFAAIDHAGRPCGVLPYEPTGHNDSLRYVGAKLVATITKKATVGTGQQTEQDTSFEYDSKPTSVPSTPYYEDAIRKGVLIAANQETAAALSLRWEEPGKALERLRDERLSHQVMVHAHDDHDDDFHDALIGFFFGPMPDAKKARASAEAEAKNAPPAEPTAEEKASAARAKRLEGLTAAAKTKRAEKLEKPKTVEAEAPSKGGK